MAASVPDRNARCTTSVFVPTMAAAEAGAYIRRTYAHFARAGVANDGVADGEEYTRNQFAPPHWGGTACSRVLDADALRADLARHAALDRYGFYDAKPAHAHTPPVVLERVALVRAAQAVRAPFATRAIRASLRPRTMQRDVRRVQKWQRMLVLQEGRVALHASPDVLRRRVYKGIPDVWRGAVWYALAQNPCIKHAPPTLDVPSAHDVQIDLDVPRTIRGHIHFHTRYGRGQRDLFAVLHAASLLCDECGYCQGMGPLAGVLLLYMVPDDAYAMLVQLHTHYALHDFFRPGFPGLREELFVLQTLMQQYTPRTAAALASLGVAPSAFATGWYMTLFSGVLPFPTQLRLWDVFLLDGREVLTLAALAIVQTLEAKCDASPSDWLIEALSAPIVPEDDDALLQYILVQRHATPTQRTIHNARAAWAARCAANTADAAFL